MCCLDKRQCSQMQMSASHAATSLLTSLSWQSLPISTWMVFNYVPRGYHSHSISSVWQCNSLCPAAMSAKLRQFTCSCSYTAMEEGDLPSILCVHLISGTQNLTWSNMCCHMHNRVKVWTVFAFCFSLVFSVLEAYRWVWYFCTI